LARAIRGIGPERPEFRLAENELLVLWPGLRLRFYREDGVSGDLEQGFRDRVMGVAQRAANVRVTNR